MTETPESVNGTWDAPVEATKSIPVDIPSADPITIEHDACQVVEGEYVRMEQSASFSVLADDVEMHESAAFVIRAEEVRIEDSVTFILSAGEVKGNVTTIFTPVTAAIVGVSLMLGMWLMRPRR